MKRPGPRLIVLFAGLPAWHPACWIRAGNDPRRYFPIFSQIGAHDL